MKYCTVVVIITTEICKMVKSTKRGYKEGRLKRDDNEEDSDDKASRRNDKDYNDLSDGDEDKEDKEDEEYEEEEYDKEKYSNIKRRKEEVSPIGKSKGDEDTYWANKLDQMRDLLEEYKKDNILLRAELRAARGSHETMKRKMHVELGWDGEEANLSEYVANYCRTYLLPRFKFLKDKWDVFDPEQPNSLSNFVKNRLKSLSVQTTVIYERG